MYTRSYYPEGEERMSIPDNYDGTAFLERKEPPSRQDATEVSFMEASETLPKKPQAREEAAATSVFGNFPLLSGLFGGGLSSLNLKMPKIGTEEILIIAAAAFLFFSKNGDRESALILLLLLLIN